MLTENKQRALLIERICFNILKYYSLNLLFVLKTISLFKVKLALIARDIDLKYSWENNS